MLPEMRPTNIIVPESPIVCLLSPHDRAVTHQTNTAASRGEWKNNSLHIRHMCVGETDVVGICLAPYLVQCAIRLGFTDLFSSGFDKKPKVRPSALWSTTSWVT